MIKSKRILFFGELPEESVHGISIANSINIEMLRSAYHVDIIIEHNKFGHHDRFSLKKVFFSVSDCLKIAYKAIRSRYRYIYLVFSLSTFGSLKTFLAIFVYKIFSRGDVILHIHRGDFFSRFYKGLFNILLTKLIFRLTDKVIVLSDSQVKEFEDKFSNTFVPLPNTITRECKPERRFVGNRNFLFISNYLIDKGIYDLIEVFKTLTAEIEGISLTCFGEYPDNTVKEALINFATDRISINGPVRESEKYEELAKADCLILPSWNEGQPVIVLEAMSVGTPVISSNVGLISEMVGIDYQFLTIPKDRTSLKKKILEYIEYSSKDIISENLYERYNEFYSRDIHYSSLMTVFR